MASALVALPALLFATTLNVEALSEAVVAGVVKEDDVAPLMVVPFFFH
jgi:hypothetical protein